MSNLYVSNIFFEVTSNNGFTYTGSNTFQAYAGGVLNYTVNTTGMFHTTTVNATAFTTAAVTANLTNLTIGPFNTNATTMVVGPATVNSTVAVIGPTTINATVLSSGALTVNSTAVVTSTNTFNLGVANTSGTALGSNGYTYLPNGLIFMWGLASGNTAGSTYTFLSTCGKSFPTNCMSMTVAGTGTGINVSVQSLNSTSFTLYAANTSGRTMYFMAIGY